jgi:hypothetical protein
MTSFIAQKIVGEVEFGSSGARYNGQARTQSLALDSGGYFLL